MKKFQFRLDTVLKLRKKKEDLALQEFAKAQRAYQSEIHNRAFLMQRLEQALERREKLGVTEVSSVAFKTEEDFISGTKQRIIQAGQAILRAHRSLQKAMSNYLHFKKQTMVLEKLEETQFAKFKEQLRKREERELDDLTIMRRSLLNDKN